jgi:hypothetical protein
VVNAVEKDSFELPHYHGVPQHIHRFVLILYIVYMLAFHQDIATSCGFPELLDLVRLGKGLKVGFYRQGSQACLTRFAGRSEEESMEPMKWKLVKSTTDRLSGWLCCSFAMLVVFLCGKLEPESGSEQLPSR